MASSGSNNPTKKGSTYSSSSSFVSSKLVCSNDFGSSKTKIKMQNQKIVRITSQSFISEVGKKNCLLFIKPENDNCLSKQRSVLLKTQRSYSKLSLISLINLR
jgi:hypothetical protein